MKALIGSKNQGKIESAKEALSLYFKDVEVIGIPVPSGVGDEPVNEEIYEGAKNRIENLKKYAKENKMNVDLYMSIESGINKVPCGYVISNVAMIEDKNGLFSYGTGPQFPVPDRYVEDIIKTDLSIVMDKIFGEDKERHNKGGGIQMLTHGKITRIDSSKMAFVMALTKIINGETWK
ncbi:MAG: DUF84 family protein [Clostridia bacterium]|nr:DUF84 family protein [Clostridia bacterium]